MADDMRMSPGVADHRKIERLCRALGDGAFRCLVRLWGYAAQERRDGRLTGMTDEDIEAEARWSGEPGLFVRTLTAVRLLDIQAGGSGGRTVSLHNWPSRQAFIVSFAERSAKAAENARVGWERRRQTASESGNADGMPPACDPHLSAERPARAAHAPSLPPTNHTDPPHSPPASGGASRPLSRRAQRRADLAAELDRSKGLLPCGCARTEQGWAFCEDHQEPKGEEAPSATTDPGPPPDTPPRLTALLQHTAAPEKGQARRWQRSSGLHRLGEEVPALSPADEERRIAELRDQQARLEREERHGTATATADLDDFTPPPPPEVSQ